jgi:thiosulfate reductase cytochrome b subunit
MSTQRIMIYSRFERFWHWTQMVLIFILLFTGLAVRGLHDTLRFESAVTVHTWSAFALIALWLLAIFWHFTTGAWRHYLPTGKGLWAVARFYAWGIFKGEHHPYRKAFWRKHNPLQALTYLALKLFLFPAVWLSGLLYLSYAYWGTAGGALGWIAIVHVVSAYAILAFVIAHVYMLTTGHSFIAHVRPMIDGYDAVDLSAAEEAYLRERRALGTKD